MWVTALFVLFVGPILWVFLGAKTFFVARDGGLSRHPRLVLVPRLDVRGLSAAALWLSLALSGYFIWFERAFLDSGPAAFTWALLVPDFATMVLAMCYVMILRRLQPERHMEPAVGLELPLAYAATLVGCIPPALLAASLVFFNRNASW